LSILKKEKVMNPTNINISAEITGLRYQVFFVNDLTEVNFADLNINSAPSSFLISDKKYNYGISKWVSPKRTRSYPFERVYNTLNVPKRITVIPIIKDEGAKGDRDFIQWDTVSLMSLLDVYVIFAYYNKAIKHTRRENKITKQEFDNDYVKSKIIEISNYHSSALHWNLKEIKETLPGLIDFVKSAYDELHKQLGVEFHNPKGLQIFKDQFLTGVEEFMNTSRSKAKDAQNRERLTTQPKEHLITLTKATITIKNYLGGIYYFTTDEIKIIDNNLLLIEGKHSRDSKLPSIGDIKDGLLKMVLYCNLTDVKIDGEKLTPKPILKLTSENLSGRISSNDSKEEISSFREINGLSDVHSMMIDQLIEGAKINNFEIVFEGI